MLEVGIVIPQWNSSRDTVECLDSLMPAVEAISCHIVVVDNGSSEVNRDILHSFLNQKGFRYDEVFYSGRDSLRAEGRNWKTNLTLIQCEDNLGFAKACNLGIKYLGIDNCQWFLFLNNDTIVQPNFLQKLLEAANCAKEIEVWAPVITYYSNPNLIWDIGGELKFWGDRTFPGRKKMREKYPKTGYQKRTFLTGCALLVKAEIFKDLGLFTERFFFGEEDYWFAMHLKHHNRLMAVCWESEIQHKVATSIKKISPNSMVPLVYIHNLNRIVNMRFWLKSWAFSLWKIFYLPYAVYRLWWKNWYSIRLVQRFICLLWKNSNNKSEVTKQDFYQARELFS